jgi:PAS domain-containing protein
MSIPEVVDPGEQSQRDYDANLEVWPAQVAYLLRELDDVRAQLADSEETLRAIRHGEVDALVITAGAGREQVFTLSNADRPYRNFVENMSDGAATVSSEGIVLYANQAFADLVALASHQVVGRPVLQFVTDASQARLADMLGPARRRPFRLMVPRSFVSPSWTSPANGSPKPPSRIRRSTTR